MQTSKKATLLINTIILCLLSSCACMCVWVYVCVHEWVADMTEVKGLIMHMFLASYSTLATVLK